MRSRAGYQIPVLTTAYQDCTSYELVLRIRDPLLDLDRPSNSAPDERLEAVALLEGVSISPYSSGHRKMERTCDSGGMVISTPSEAFILNTLK